MPNIGGQYRPLSPIQRQGIYRQALQILRGQLGAQATGHGSGIDEGYIERRAIEKYLAGSTVVPADRGAIRQIVQQAERAHATAASIEGQDRPVPLSGLNIDPTLGDAGPRVRYRVVVAAEDTDGNRSEMLVLVDADRPLGYDEIQSRAFDQARAADPMLTKGYNVRSWSGPDVALEAFVVAAGKRR